MDALPTFDDEEVGLVLRYPVADGTPPSQALVEAAELAGCDPDSSDVVLADVVRGTALDRLFVPGGDAFVTVPVWGLLFAVGRDEVLVLERL